MNWNHNYMAYYFSLFQLNLFIAVQNWYFIGFSSTFKEKSQLRDWVGRKTVTISLPENWLVPSVAVSTRTYQLVGDLLVMSNWLRAQASNDDWVVVQNSMGFRIYFHNKQRIHFYLNKDGLCSQKGADWGGCIHYRQRCYHISQHSWWGYNTGYDLTIYAIISKTNQEVSVSYHWSIHWPYAQY